ncbi:MAG TPA: hypothetical protein DCP37_18250 [Dehalococcoidia bacterium]|nr:hypothetical protein [Dehalococcoidia bacterium]
MNIFILVSVFRDVWWTLNCGNHIPDHHRKSNKWGNASVDNHGSGFVTSAGGANSCEKIILRSAVVVVPLELPEKKATKLVKPGN